MTRDEALSFLRTAGYPEVADALVAEQEPATPADEAAAVVEIIDAQAAAEVRIIEAETAAEIEVMEAAADVTGTDNGAGALVDLETEAPTDATDEIAADLADNGMPDGSAPTRDPLPAESHWFFRPLGRK